MNDKPVYNDATMYYIRQQCNGYPFTVFKASHGILCVNTMVGDDVATIFLLAQLSHITHVLPPCYFSITSQPMLLIN